MKNVNEEFAKRLKKAMEQKGYPAKPAVLEREFNLRYWGRAVSLHGVRRWLRGESLPTQDKLEVLAEWLQVQPQHLRYGVEIEKRVRQRKAAWEQAIGYQEREVFEAFIHLPTPQRKIVREVILAFAQAHSAKTK